MDDAKSTKPHAAQANTAARPSQAATEPSGDEPAQPQLTEAQCQAHLIRNALVPGLMSQAMAPSGAVNGLTVRGYRDELLREAGNPKDPLERLLIEQVTLSHVMVIQLQVHCAGADSAEKAGVYAAAARLMAESRLMVLAIRDYRTPPARPQVTRIQQQNLAERQEVTFVSRPDASESAADEPSQPEASMSCRDKNNPDSRLASNVEPEEGNAISPTATREGKVRRPSGRWATEPTIAGAADGEGPEAPF